MKVCFFCLNAFPLFDPTIDKPIGGMETRAWLFARGLSRLDGFDVKFVVEQRDPHQIGLSSAGNYDGVHVFEYWQEGMPWPWILWLERQSRVAALSAWSHRSFPWIKFRQFRWSLLWQLPMRVLWAMGLVGFRFYFRATAHLPRSNAVLGELDADVFCTFGVNWFAVEVLKTARKTGRKTVLFLASDADLDERFVRGWGKRMEDGVRGSAGRAALKLADQIVVQNQRQQQRLDERFGRRSERINNPIDLKNTEHGRDSHPQNGQRDHVLWVGRADTFHKRPRLLLALARQCPEIPFVMILNTVDEQLYNQLVSEAPDNVHIVPQVPFPEMREYFGRARAFVSTSSRAFEGFPNVFLQAGKFRVPIVSLEVDPDGVLATNNCGVVCSSDMKQLTDGLRAVWSDRDMAQELSDKWYEYIKANHDWPSCVGQLASVLERFGAQ